jgi:GNAT superfamily N-acetyltransferase
MPYEIRTPNASDAAGIAKVQVHAFYQDPHWACNWPNMTLEEIAQGTFNRLPFNFSRSRDTVRHQIVIDNTTGEIVGHAKWSFLNVNNAAELWAETQVAEVTEAEKKVYEERSKLGLDEKGGHKGAVRLVSTQPLADECDSIVNGQRFLGTVFLFTPHSSLSEKHSFFGGSMLIWTELDLIGTLPSHGRKGVGSMLLKSGIAAAETAGLPVLVMAYPFGVKLYQKHGFELLNTINEDYSPYGLDIGPHVVSFLVRKHTP